MAASLNNPSKKVGCPAGHPDPCRQRTRDIYTAKLFGFQGGLNKWERITR